MAHLDKIIPTKLIGNFVSICNNILHLDRTQPQCFQNKSNNIQITLAKVRNIIGGRVSLYKNIFNEDHIFRAHIWHCIGNYLHNICQHVVLSARLSHRTKSGQDPQLETEDKINILLYFGIFCTSHP